MCRNHRGFDRRQPDLKSLDFREHFIQTESGGAERFRAAIRETTDRLAEIFESADAPYSGLPIGELDRALAAEFESSEQISLSATMETVARNSILTQHPNCAAHLHTPPMISAIAAEVVIAALNQSMDSWDQASAATLVETQMVAWFAEKIAFGQGADGVFTGGGTESNYLGLLLARGLVCERNWGCDIFKEGLPNEARNLRVLTSENAHFTVAKSMARLGLGTKSVIAVDCDAEGRMKPGALQQLLEKVEPMAVVATAGTTDLGAIDPLTEIAEICEQQKVWLHVDAAYGGGLLLTDQRKQLRGIERADSIALDFHKLFFQPISCGLFLLRDGENFRFIEQHADYLNREADPRPNLVDKSVVTSRRFDALKIWMTLKNVGPDQLGAMIERVLQLAKYAAELVKRSPKLELLADPSLTTILFRFAGSDELNCEVHEQLLASGRAVIGRTSFNGQVALKLTLLNPSLTEAQIENLIELIESEGNRLETASKSATA
ncbi:MAG: glutamate/tyrosine decarboxylase-like PLP-dependent enzyme [Verrucomicrobiales bacterium]